MIKRMARHARSHAIAYLALFLALGGTAYAATSFIEAPPNGGTGGTNVSNLQLRSVESKPVGIAGLATLNLTCAANFSIDVNNTSGAKLDVFQNVDAPATRTTIVAGDNDGVLTINDETAVGQIQLSNLPGGTARAATVQLAVQEQDGRCRVLLQSLHVAKPAT